MASSEGKSPRCPIERSKQHSVDGFKGHRSISWIVGDRGATLEHAKDPNIHTMMAKHKNIATNCRIMKSLLHPMFYTPKAFDQRMLHQPKVIWVLLIALSLCGQNIGNVQVDRAYRVDPSCHWIPVNTSEATLLI